MSDDPWQIGRLDLDGYLQRLGVPARDPGRKALDELHEAHVRAFTFDNIDVLLEQHPGVSTAALDEKFVGRGRGGYCFEHASVFAAAAERLGYRVTRRLGRVGVPSEAGRTHMVVWVDIDGDRLLCDLGFGLTLVRPIPLGDGAEDDYLGWTYRVRRVATDGAAAWELHRFRDEGWELMHTHDELTVYPADVTMGHHFTSTFPDSHFRHRLMVTRLLPERHVTVTDSAVTVRRGGRPTEHRPLGDGELADMLAELGVPLTDDEQRRLLAKVATLPAA